MFETHQGNVHMTWMPILPIKRTYDERFDGRGKDRTLAKAKGACARRRLLADYETGVQHGSGQFIGWFRQEPRPGFTKATVSAWRASLEMLGLGASSTIVRMSAIRKLAAEAADNGPIAPELAAGIARVKSAKSTGIRAGNRLSLRQAQSLLSAPDIQSEVSAIGPSWLSFSDAVLGDQR